MNTTNYHRHTVSRDSLAYRADQFGWKQTDEYEDDTGDWSVTYRSETQLKIAIDAVRELHGKPCNNIFLRSVTFTVSSVKQYDTLVGLVNSHQPSVGTIFISPAPHARASRRGDNVTEVESAVDPDDYLYVPFERVESSITKNGCAGPYAARWVGRSGEITVPEFSEVLDCLSRINDQILVTADQHEEY